MAYHSFILSITRALIPGYWHSFSRDFQCIFIVKSLERDLHCTYPKDNYPASIHIYGEFNIHHKEWAAHSNKTVGEAKLRFDFYIAYELTRILD